MKKTAFFLLLTSLLLGFSACETNDPSDPGNGTMGTVSLSAD